MKKHFTKVLCSLILSATITSTGLAQDNIFRSSGQQETEIKSTVCNTRGDSWRYYDNGKYKDGIGGPDSFLWGIMLPSTTFSVGATLTKVALFDNTSQEGFINIYFGGTSKPELLVHRQPYTTTGSNDFVEFDLTAPIPLFGDNIWVILSTEQGGEYPAAMCVNTGDKNGRWISLDEKTWEDLTTYKLDGTWMIRAYIEGDESGFVNISELNSSFNIYPNPVNDRLFIETEANIEKVEIYDVYGRQQDNKSISQQVIDVTDLNSGVYFVKVVTDNGEIVKRFVKK